MTETAHLNSQLQKENLPLLHYRKDFPILDQCVNGYPLVYLDNAASMQMPISVIKSFEKYYTTIHANVHRGVHTLSQLATDQFEMVREKVRSFINAPSANEIIFTYGTTDSLNLVASTFGKVNVREGDVILVSEMEHHANFVPWYMLAQEKKATIVRIPITDSGELDFDAYLKLLQNKPVIVAVTHVSNALGTINPIREICDAAHEVGAVVVVDGAQAVPHMSVNVADLNCDFYAFSAHKICGPTGVGVLFGKLDWLTDMPPYRGGGDMIKTVSFNEVTFNDVPFRFEAGTPAISQVIMMGEAIDYLTNIGMTAIKDHEDHLLRYATDLLSTLPGITIIGTAPNKASVLSFVMQDIHPHDIGTILDQFGVAVRTGHHCAQPVMERFCIPATTRASFAFYNTYEDVDMLITALKEVQEVFG
jgi:cysteine desulfurase / selenocysteine lyase